MGLVMVAAAVLGYVMRPLGLSIIAFIVAFVPASPLPETALITGGDVSLIPSHPIALVLLALPVVSVVWLGPRHSRMQPADAAPGQG